MKITERYPYLPHVLVWTFVIFWPFILFPFQTTVTLVVYKVVSDALLIGIFYLNLLYLIPKLIKDKKGLYYASILMGYLLISIGINYLISLLIKEQWATQPGQTIGTIASFIISIVVSTLFALVRDSNREREEKQQLLLEKTSNELLALKLQISPHFLFNTINNICWLARQKSDKTEASLVGLAQMLRYMLYKANSEKVPLRDEIGHLQNYLDLQKIRLTEKTSVCFKCEGEIDSLLIEPLLFIPFVENAFKYGVDNLNSSQIRIHLVASKNQISFECQNPILVSRPHQTSQETGIGIKNVERRLALNYNNRHTLEIGQDATEFRVKLILQL